MDGEAVGPPREGEIAHSAFSGHGLVQRDLLQQPSNPAASSQRLESKAHRVAAFQYTRNAA